MHDIFVKEQYFNKEVLEQAWDECRSLNDGVDFVDPEGVFKGKLVVNQVYITHPGVAVTSLLNRTQLAFDIPTRIVEASYITLYLPWDIHSDYIRRGSTKPFFNALIPLHDVDSRTIIFDQVSTEYNQFWKYKQENPKVADPIPEDIWQQYLSMCWPEDRLWLTVKEILPAQRAGQLIAFKRKYFHSSDNFHLRCSGPKHFLQIIIDEN